MVLRDKFLRGRAGQFIGVIVGVVAGLACFYFKIGDGLTRSSFDLPFAIKSDTKVDDVRLVYLKGGRDLIARRLCLREEHQFMPASLLDSQFATLEAPDASENALTFNVATPPDAIVAAVVATVSHRTE